MAWTRDSLAFAMMAFFAVTGPARALELDILDSVVSVLPVYQGKPQGGTGAPAGTAPEGSGVVVDAKGLIATAWHVVAPAESIDIRLANGRIIKAELIGHDSASDMALLKVNAPLVPFHYAPAPKLASPVCAIGNAYGLDLSVTCGVVSALRVTNAGFNAVEDFIQTDAATNPGTSGGALVDDKGRLVGMMSAIFAAKADTNIGINFAVSAALMQRIIEDLRDDGKVDYVSAGWRLAPLSITERRQVSGARVQTIAADSAAAKAGILPDDIIMQIAERPVRSPRDAVSALAQRRFGDQVEVTLLRAGTQQKLTMNFNGKNEVAPAPLSGSESGPGPGPGGIVDCPYAEPVCLTRQAVFPIESFDPLASAVRIAPDLLVTNRHVIGNRNKAAILTPSGIIEAEVVASNYRDDLVLLRALGLPKNGLILKPEEGQSNDYGNETYFAVGADIARQEIRVFEPGGLILPPADGAAYGRVHVTARMQPGVSGGALINDRGQLAGIAVGGGEGRYEALPVVQITRLLAGIKDEAAPNVQKQLGEALEACNTALFEARAAPRSEAYDPALVDRLAMSCRSSENAGSMLDAGRLLGAGRATQAAISLHEAVVARVPNSINARISLLVSLQLGGRFSDMLPHARWLLGVIPDDPQALRFAIQSGVWGGDAKLAEAAYQKLLKNDPGQAQAARRFIDQAPEAPPRR